MGRLSDLIGAAAVQVVESMDMRPERRVTVTADPVAMRTRISVSEGDMVAAVEIDEIEIFRLPESAVLLLIGDLVARCCERLDRQRVEAGLDVDDVVVVRRFPTRSPTPTESPSASPSPSPTGTATATETDSISGSISLSGSEEWNQIEPGRRDWPSDSASLSQSASASPSPSEEWDGSDDI